MLIEFATVDILIAFMGGLALLLVIVYFDRYLIRRHSSAANAAYLARMYAWRNTFDFGRMYRSARTNPNEVVLPVLKPKMLTSAPILLLLTSGRA